MWRLLTERFCRRCSRGPVSSHRGALKACFTQNKWRLPSHTGKTWYSQMFSVWTFSGMEQLQQQYWSYYDLIHINIPVCTGGSSLVSLPCQRCRERDWLSNSGFSDGNWQQRNPDLVLYLRAKFTSRATLSVHSLYFTLSVHSCKSLTFLHHIQFVSGHNPA